MFTQNVARALFPLGLDQRGSDPHPRQPAPMLLQRADKMRPSPDWLFEPKWDGFRTLASVRDGSVRLISRNGHSLTHVFGPITDALRGLRVSIVLDGEVMAINSKGRPDFEALQARLRPRNGKLAGHLCYMVFDVLYVIALRHRRTQTVLVMPPAIQSVLFQVVAVVGALLGRYRGTEWPGCPARCTGAADPAVDA